VLAGLYHPIWIIISTTKAPLLEAVLCLVYFPKANRFSFMVARLSTRDRERETSKSNAFYYIGKSTVRYTWLFLKKRGMLSQLTVVAEYISAFDLQVSWHGYSRKSSLMFSSLRKARTPERTLRRSEGHGLSSQRVEEGAAGRLGAVTWLVKVTESRGNMTYRWGKVIGRRWRWSTACRAIGAIRLE
jgi:hypothetical protein